MKIASSSTFSTVRANSGAITRPPYGFDADVLGKIIHHF